MSNLGSEVFPAAFVFQIEFNIGGSQPAKSPKKSVAKSGGRG